MKVSRVPPLSVDVTSTMAGTRVFPSKLVLWDIDDGFLAEVDCSGFETPGQPPTWQGFSAQQPWYPFEPQE